MPSGYYRYPTLHDETIVFVSEDDLWSVPACGGVARRLTSNLGEISRPHFSPDGLHLAFVGREEGQAEVYCMPAAGGPARRLTYLGGVQCFTAGWTKDGKIIFANSAEQWYLRSTLLYTIDAEGGTPRHLNYGIARSIAFSPDGGVLLGRNTDEPARWKRYRGGTVGQFWIDVQGNGEFQLLLPELGNLTSPMWLGDPGTPGRIFFISDHEGVGNLYSCLPDGSDLRRHTTHEDFYARNASTDGRRIVYHAGADIYLFDPARDHSTLVPVEFFSPRVQRNRKFVDAFRYLTYWTLHPGGQAMAVTVRGKLFTFANWEGAVIQHGPTETTASGVDTPTAIRYRLPEWLHDGKRLVAVTDASGEEAFVILHSNGSVEPEILPIMDIGRPMLLSVNPKKDQVLFSNNRYELYYLDLETRQLRLIDHSDVNFIQGFAWSPDGEWVAYSIPTSIEVTELKLWNVASGEITPLTKPVLRDVAPSFDPGGKYLYFLSSRTLDPVYDQTHFELGFPRGDKPYLITLQKDLPSPFIPKPQVEVEEKKPEEDKESKSEPPSDSPEQDKSGSGEKEKEGEKDGEEQKKLSIDLDDIQSRLVAFPVADGLYARVLGIKDGKVLYSRFPIEGALSRPIFREEPEAAGVLMCYNFEEQKEELLVSSITDFKVSGDGKMLVYRSGNRLRVTKAGEKPNNEHQPPSRKSGWIDLSRIKVEVNPGAEWRQMYREAWRLQRDQFWCEDMSQVDWLSIHDRYLPLVDRVASRSEFSDLMWEMQGELGTSHAYEFGGDYRLAPSYVQGLLGADFEYDPDSKGWRITHIHRGDSWEDETASPFELPGVNVKAGDILLAINGRKLDQNFGPAQALVNLAGEEITLTVMPAGEFKAESGETKDTRTVTVRTLNSERLLRYREWVEENRKRVHEATGGKVGYIHIPDMMAWGFSEFHRGYLAEVHRDGLIVDVRFNGGGNVSQLLLEKLARRRIGYDVSRWSRVYLPYPLHTVAGAMVALTNEQAGSDGDVFSHGFKLMGLGPLIGKRTWGGVVGIEPTHWLVDGTLTTQPEYHYWFSDVGWGLENYGTDPDIEIDIRPQDYIQGRDPQLERAIDEVLRLLQANPPTLPDFSQKPSKAAPKLPKP
jgi:tricorn protease